MLSESYFISYILIIAENCIALNKIKKIPITEGGNSSFMFSRVFQFDWIYIYKKVMHTQF